jgi:hypothetical protein
MAARLLADLFGLSIIDRTSIIDSGDPNIPMLFDLAVSNINPAMVALLVRDTAITQGQPTVLDELLSRGALAALHALRAAYGNIAVEHRVGYRWTDEPVG